MPRRRVHRPPTLEFTLKNGLRVILAPQRASPTVSVWVWYSVGSKNEWPGVTGASHWVEHMLFLGSPHFGKGEIDRAVVSVGGSLNAFTSSDVTAYFITVPREHLRIPLAIEADRMTRALIPNREVERERTVIHSEREGNENWPEFRTDEELWSLAFRYHPYRWETLGWKEDIVHLTPEQLRGYYRRYYGTRNAVLVVAGGFKPAEVRRTVERLFGPLPATGANPSVRVVEPPLAAERRSTLSGPGTTPYLELGWRAPGIGDSRSPAVMLLDAVLGGESSLFSAGAGWGRSAEHPSSRLYRDVVDTGLAVRCSSDFRPRLYPGLFLIAAQAAPGIPLDRIEAAIRASLRVFVRRGPSRRELEDAKAKVARGAELAYEGAMRTGFRLGYFATVREYVSEERLVGQLLSTSGDTVRRLAEELFVPPNGCVVGYLPKE